MQTTFKVTCRLWIGSSPLFQWCCALKFGSKSLKNHLCAVGFGSELIWLFPPVFKPKAINTRRQRGPFPWEPGATKMLVMVPWEVLCFRKSQTRAWCSTKSGFCSSFHKRMNIEPRCSGLVPPPFCLPPVFPTAVIAPLPCFWLRWS